MSEKSCKKSKINHNYFNFEGRNNYTDNHTQCDYCGKYFQNELYLDTLNYCINCWAVMDSEKLDCETLTYNSNDIRVGKVVEFITKFYASYMEDGPNRDRDDCIFKKVKQAKDNKKLHFMILREISEQEIVYKNLDEYRLHLKNRNPKINFMVSAIDI